MEKFPPLVEKLRIVIFAGGYGTRMWPVSRKTFPKQFQPIIGEKSFFRQTVERVMSGFSLQDIFVSVSEEHVKLAIEQFPEIPKKNLIIEPQRRDTLGAVGYSTAFIDYYFPKSLMVVLWGADILLRENDRFNRLLKIAARVCQVKNVICKIDVKPFYFSTSFGWVKVGKEIARLGGYSVYDFEKFIEKPDFEEAQRLFGLKSYYVNSGYFVWRTNVMLDFYKRFSPECFSRLEKIQKIIGNKEKREILEKEYSLIEKTSVDYGLFEKLPKESFLVIPADLGWQDVGNWDSLYEALAVGQKQNVTKGEVEYLEAQGNLVYMPKGKMAAIIGVNDLIIIDSKDGLLVVKRGKAGDVKKFVDTLKEKDKLEYL